MDDLAANRRPETRRPRRRMSKGMYILPSLFTAGNMAAGFYAILEIIHSSAVNFGHLDNAAVAIGFAVLFDGLDGRVARMTGTSSEFGKELDSGRCHNFWGRAGDVSVDVGVLSDASDCAYQMGYQADPIRSDRELPLSDGGSKPSGAFQHHV